MTGPRILLIDIETAPILADVWRLFDQDVSLNQIVKDWHLLAWGAKWLDAPEDEMFYFDQSKAREVENDKTIIKEAWKLLNQADIVVTHNGISFDIPRLNARFAYHGLPPVSPFKHHDTKVIAKKYFGFTSNKLEYLAGFLKVPVQKMVKRQFAGHYLWRECLRGNQDAWAEMKAYNLRDVLALQGVFERLRPWDKLIDYSIYSDSEEHVCVCGCTEHDKRGYSYTAIGKFQRYVCTKCGRWSRGRENLLSKEKRKSIRSVAA